MVNKQHSIGLGDELKQLREQHGLSQSELARRTGLAQSTITRLESGVVTRLHPSRLAALASALGVPEADLHDAAGYEPADLPPLPVYLRTKYGQKLTPALTAALEQFITQLTTKGGTHETPNPEHPENGPGYGDEGADGPAGPAARPRPHPEAPTR